MSSMKSYEHMRLSTATASHHMQSELHNLRSRSGCWPTLIRSHYWSIPNCELVSLLTHIFEVATGSDGSKIIVTTVPVQWPRRSARSNKEFRMYKFGLIGAAAIAGATLLRKHAAVRVQSH